MGLSAHCAYIEPLYDLVIDSVTLLLISAGMRRVVPGQKGSAESADFTFCTIAKESHAGYIFSLFVYFSRVM